MIALLEPEIFASSAAADLMVLLWLGATMRHRIVVADDRDTAYTGWLAALDPATRAEWERVVGDGLGQHAKEPSQYEVWVAARGPSTWAAPMPTLTVADAVEFLQRPYRILVENGFSDRAFLLSFSDPRTRAFLEERIAREWVEVEHCGGNDHLEKRAKEIRKQPSARMRCSALFDGDGMQPNQPSAKSASIQAICYPDVHHHQLERRAIENYLPRAALERWARRAQGRARIHREAQVDALFALQDGQRAHYNMKGGFKKDEPNAHRAGTLFSGVSDESRRLLYEGLGEDIAGLYRDGDVRFHELEPAGAVDHVQAFAREIVARIR